MMANEEVSIEELVVVPTHTSNEEYEVESKEEKVEEYEEMSHEGHKN